MATIAVDTSVAVPYLVRSPTHHRIVRRYLAAHEPCLTGHSLVEAYSVLTRLPGDARLTPADASKLIAANFPAVATLPLEVAVRIHVMLSEHDISGGAVYDAIVALAARHGGLSLATRDARAASTYLALAVRVELIPG